MNTAYILQLRSLRLRPLFPALPNWMIPHFQTIFSIFLDIFAKNLYNYILIISLINQLTLFSVCCSFFDRKFRIFSCKFDNFHENVWSVIVCCPSTCNSNGPMTTATSASWRNRQLTRWKWILIWEKKIARKTRKMNSKH